MTQPSETRRRLGLWFRPRRDRGASRPSLARRIGRAAALAVLAGIAFSILWVGLYRLVPPPLTTLMVIGLFEGHGLQRDWRSIDEVSPHLLHAIIASEDSRFCQHAGFDWQAIRQARARNLDGGTTFGASTVTMQTAKNAFLWPARSWPRKAAEAYFTVLIETLWNKRRIMEVYVNIAEWGEGIYGAEAAAQTYFRKPAADLTRGEAALLAVVLPNPRRWSPAQPTRYIQGRSQTIQQRMRIVANDGLAACL